MDEHALRFAGKLLDNRTEHPGKRPGQTSQALLRTVEARSHRLPAADQAMTEDRGDKGMGERMNKIACSAAVLALGVALGGVWTQPVFAQAADAYCVDALRNGASLTVPMGEYAVVLLGNTIAIGDRPNRVIAKATLLLKAPPPHKRELYPMVAIDQDEVVVQCQDPIRTEQMLEVFME